MAAGTAVAVSAAAETPRKAGPRAAVSAAALAVAAAWETAEAV